MKPTTYDFNKNAMTVISPNGTEIEVTNALTKAQRKKLTRTVTRLIHRVNGKNGMRVKL
jgi:hypothetical protein